MSKKKPELWTKEDDDTLLDKYLRMTGMGVISVEMKRSLDSLGRRLLRLCSGQRNCSKYQPKNRIDRKGLPFNKRDLTLIQNCMGSLNRELKIAEWKDRLKHLSKVLMRTEEEIEKYLNKDRGEGFV